MHKRQATADKKRWKDADASPNGGSQPNLSVTISLYVSKLSGVLVEHNQLCADES
jgi:hypothetical protein